MGKVDGRSKPRTQKQIELYRYNFSTRRDSLAKRVEQELDSRLSFLQRTSRVVLVSSNAWKVVRLTSSMHLGMKFPYYLKIFIYIYLTLREHFCFCYWYWYWYWYWHKV